MHTCMYSIYASVRLRASERARARARTCFVYICYTCIGYVGMQDVNIRLLALFDTSFVRRIVHDVPIYSINPFVRGTCRVKRVSIHERIA